MLFSSITFIYYFLPILLLTYFIFKNKYRNTILLIFSLVFYYYGEPKYVIILILSCIINYFIGNLIANSKQKKLYLITGIILNASVLLYFKYTNFFINNINTIFNTNLKLLKIVMPIGISFFTFQTISYLIDVYNKKIMPSKNIIDFSTYVCLFPQLIAGPIVRYIDVDKELKSRKHSYENFANGITRFIIGLAKKVLIANVLGELCKNINGIDATVLSSWISAICFTLQIYFDFSGYSDMAIGLGRIFGFNFLENFNYPLASKSITEFWRKWHISLSSWLRDYIYIPLGGNRVGKIKWYRNILITWFVTGFWHGASWNFIIWGLFFAIILILEKNIYGKYVEKHKIIGHIYTIITIIISFVIFNYEDLNLVILNLKNMFLLSNIDILNSEIMYYLKSYFMIIVIAIIASTPFLKNIYQKIKTKEGYKKISMIEPLIVLLLLIIVTSFLIDSSYNPFLYFRF